MADLNPIAIDVTVPLEYRIARADGEHYRAHHAPLTEPITRTFDGVRCSTMDHVHAADGGHLFRRQRRLRCAAATRVTARATTDLDLWLSSNHYSPDCALAEVRPAALDTFQRQPKHDWPSTSVIHHTWRRHYPKVPEATATVDEAATPLHH